MGIADRASGQVHRPDQWRGRFTALSPGRGSSPTWRSSASSTTRSPSPRQAPHCVGVPALFGGLSLAGYMAVVLAIVLIRPASLLLSIIGTSSTLREKLTQLGSAERFRLRRLRTTRPPDRHPAARRGVHPQRRMHRVPDQGRHLPALPALDSGFHHRRTSSHTRPWPRRMTRGGSWTSGNRPSDITRLHLRRTGSQVARPRSGRATSARCTRCGTDRAPAGSAPRARRRTSVRRGVPAA